MGGTFSRQRGGAGSGSDQGAEVISLSGSTGSQTPFVSRRVSGSPPALHARTAFASTTQSSYGTPGSNLPQVNPPPAIPPQAIPFFRNDYRLLPLFMAAGAGVGGGLGGGLLVDPRVEDFLSNFDIPVYVLPIVTAAAGAILGALGYGALRCYLLKYGCRERPNQTQSTTAAAGRQQLAASLGIAGSAANGRDRTLPISNDEDNGVRVTDNNDPHFQQAQALLQQEEQSSTSRPASLRVGTPPLQETDDSVVVDMRVRQPGGGQLSPLRHSHPGGRTAMDISAAFDPTGASVQPRRPLSDVLFPPN